MWLGDVTAWIGLGIAAAVLALVVIVVLIAALSPFVML